MINGKGCQRCQRGRGILAIFAKILVSEIKNNYNKTILLKGNLSERRVENHDNFRFDLEFDRVTFERKRNKVR